MTDLVVLYALALGVLGTLLLWSVSAAYIRLAESQERRWKRLPSEAGLAGAAAPKPRAAGSKAWAFGLLG